MMIDEKMTFNTAYCILLVIPSFSDFFGMSPNRP